MLGGNDYVVRCVMLGVSPVPGAPVTPVKAPEELKLLESGQLRRLEWGRALTAGCLKQQGVNHPSFDKDKHLNSQVAK